MLHSNDAKVVEVDPELPALKILLDDAAALAIFAKYAPSFQPTAARCTYLRYKPHTSCIAAFLLETRNGELLFHLTAYRTDAVSKLAKVRRNSQSRGTRCPTPIVLPELGLVISEFPYDRELPALEHVSHRKGQAQLLSRLFPEEGHQLDSSEWTTLRYKPGRRYVARLEVGGQPQAVLKIHSEQAYAHSRRAAKSLSSLSGIPTACPLGHSDRHRTLLHEWLCGETLASLIAEPHLPRNAMQKVGRLLARLHAHQTTKLPHHTIEQESQKLHQGAEDLIGIVPPIKSLLREVSQTCALQLAQLPRAAVPIHGDCHPQQFVIADSEIALLDLDSAALGHPARDLGNFLAHLEREVLQGAMHRSLCDQLVEELLCGYSKTFSSPNRHAVQTYLASGLLRLAHEPFRYRKKNWHEETEKLVERANQILGGLKQRAVAPALSETRIKAVTGYAGGIDVLDPYGLRADNGLQNAAIAIEPSVACNTIVPVMRQAFDDESLALRSIRVVKVKPGRRCLIEYACVSTAGNHDVTVLGKVHARSRHERSYRLQQALWESGFDTKSNEGISVARPVGLVPDCQMWLQECVPGTNGWEALSGPQGESIAARIAEAAHKLHQTDIVTERVHTIEDELQILEEKLPQVARRMPWLRSRLDTVLAACRELAASISSSPLTGIHRDFYPDQIRVDGDRLYVLDHDLYCRGDPCLDIGNFNGHLIERSLRDYGYSEAYLPCQHALVEQFCSLRKDCNPAVIDAYTTLTVVRHIYLSTHVAGRRSSTISILEYCERALSCLVA